KDADVKDRELSDYTGEWQSVYPLLKDGILDEVFDYKAKLNKDMTAAEYKDYYTTGYKTDIDTINIKDNTIDFVVNGEHHQ
ncbi:ZinT/AdcA family metal-binding protein, partial [Parabacteroides distasonis]